MTIAEINEFGELIKVAIENRQRLRMEAEKYLPKLAEAVESPLFKNLSQAEQEFYTYELAAINALLTRQEPA